MKSRGDRKTGDVKSPSNFSLLKTIITSQYIKKSRSSYAQTFLY